MKALLAIPALLLATSALAECPSRIPTEAPAVPSGDSATHEEMYKAQEAMKEYVSTIEAYLDCRTELHPLQYSRSIYLAESAADSYNAELAKFRERENMLATN